MTTNLKTIGGCIRTTTAALFLSGSLAAVSQAASLSPVGQWDCISGGGGQDGIAFLEFTSTPGSVAGTYSLLGYELLGKLPRAASANPRGSNNTGRGGSTTDTNTPTGGTNHFVIGFTSDGIEGDWAYDVKSNIIGYLYFTVVNVSTGEENVNAVSFTGKVSGKDPNKRLTIVASTDFGKVTYKGLPLIEVTNASGNFVGSWYGLKKQNNQSFQEFFTLTPAGYGFANIYRMDGSGAGYVYTNGICMVSRQNKIGFSVHEETGTNSLNRASIGSFNKKKATAKTKGAIFPYDSSDAIKFDATKF